MADRVRRRADSGWAVAAVVAATLVAGVGLFVLQVVNTDAAWRTCFGHEPDLEAGGRFAAMVAGLARLVGYPAVLLATAVPAWLLGRRMKHPWLAYLITLVLTAIAVFWTDYYQHNALSVDYWQHGCPEGRPPWWPSWTGIEPRSQ